LASPFSEKSRIHRLRFRGQRTRLDTAQNQPRRINHIFTNCVTPTYATNVTPSNIQYNQGNATNPNGSAAIE
jgi:hypothetical protein